MFLEVGVDAYSGIIRRSCVSWRTRIGSMKVLETQRAQRVAAAEFTQRSYCIADLMGIAGRPEPIGEAQSVTLTQVRLRLQRRVHSALRRERSERPSTRLVGRGAALSILMTRFFTSSRSF